MCGLVATLLLGTGAAVVSAGELTPSTARDFDIEDLMDMPIAIAERQEEPLQHSAAAVTVITAEDIRRSGHQRLPDLLRMVPGLHVARVNGNVWAVSSRTENTRFSGTMLVLRDGRTLYSPLFAGVYWEHQDLLLEDVERIEIIRGPGAALWGANAVSGVINVVTKNASASQGTQVVGYAGAGEAHEGGSVRWGGALNDAVDVKLWGQAWSSPSSEGSPASQGTNEGFVPVGAVVDDGSAMARGGAELFWRRSADSDVRVQVESWDTSIDEQRVTSFPAGLEESDVDARGLNAVLRWTWRDDEGGASYVQVFHDRTRRADMSFEEERSTTDVDVQYGHGYGRHELTFGAGWRRTDDDTGPRGDGIFRLDGPSDHEILLSAFVHDRMSLVDERLDVIVGSKIEAVEGFETQLQPTLRLWAAPTEGSALWVGATRSIRKPSRAGRDSYLDFNAMGGPCPGEVDPELGCIVRTGNPASTPISVVTGEVGLRMQLGSAVHLDVSAFHDDYDQSATSSEIGSWDRAYGIETVLHWRPGTSVRLEAWHAWHRQFLKDQEDATAGRKHEDGLIPRHSAFFRAAWDPRPTWTADALVYYVDAVSTPYGTNALPSHVRVDLGGAWHPDPRWSLSAHVVDLFDEATAEGLEAQRLTTARRRGLQLRTVVRF